MASDLAQVDNKGFGFLDFERTWQGPGTVTCLTPQGYESADVVVTVIKSGLHLGAEPVAATLSLTAEVGASNFQQLEDSFDLGVSAGATALIVNCQGGLTFSGKTAGGLSIKGKAACGPALGIGANVTFGSQMIISELHPRAKR
jgi:hypothetical protein